VTTRFLAVRGRQQRLPLLRNTGSNIHDVPVERFSISLEQDLAARVRARAGAEGTAISAWVAEALDRRLRNDGLRSVVADWQREHGAFTEEELRRAGEELGLEPREERHP